jgi:hypothetical protein
MSQSNFDIDLHTHLKLILTIAPISAEQRNGLAGYSRHGNADQISVSYDSIRRIEFDPAGAWDVNLTSCMGRSTSKQVRSIAAGNIDIASDKARGETQSASGLNHQKAKSRQVPFVSSSVVGGL